MINLEVTSATIVTHPPTHTYSGVTSMSSLSVLPPSPLLLFWQVHVDLQCYSRTIGPQFASHCKGDLTLRQIVLTKMWHNLRVSPGILAAWYSCPLAVVRERRRSSECDDDRDRDTATLMVGFRLTTHSRRTTPRSADTSHFVHLGNIFIIILTRTALDGFSIW